jgi:hypothetical protein
VILTVFPDAAVEIDCGLKAQYFERFQPAPSAKETYSANEPALVAMSTVISHCLVLSSNNFKTAVFRSAAPSWSLTLMVTVCSDPDRSVEGNETESTTGAFRVDPNFTRPV